MKNFRNLKTTLLSLAVVAAFSLHSPSKALAVTTSWTGAGDGFNWSDVSNWNNGTPSNGSVVAFEGSLSDDIVVNNDLSGLALSQIRVYTDSDDFGWGIFGNSITLSSGIFDSSDGIAFNIAVNNITASSNLIYRASNWASLALASSTNIGSRNIYLNTVDSGLIALTGNIKGTGNVVVNGNSIWGTELSGGVINPTTVVRGGGSLGGEGKVAAIRVESGGKLKPSGGCISTRNLLARGELYPVLNGNTFCASYFGIKTRGTVDVTGTKLKFALKPGYAPVKGKTFILVENDGTDKVKGTFYGRPEGKKFTIGKYSFQITYKGGTGNDIKIKRL